MVLLKGYLIIFVIINITFCCFVFNSLEFEKIKPGKSVDHCGIDEFQVFQALVYVERESRVHGNQISGGISRSVRND